MLLDAGHIHSGYSQPWAIGAGSANDRPWVVSGDAFGLMAWTTADQAYELFYKDDDARGLLGAIVTAGVLKTPRWHTTITTATLANLRQTAENGFGPSSGPFAGMVGADLSPSEGWRRVYDVSCHDIAAIWVAFFSRCQRYCCRQAHFSKPGFSPHYESCKTARLSDSVCVHACR